jgi:hypothetical protein
MVQPYLVRRTDVPGGGGSWSRRLRHRHIEVMAHLPHFLQVTYDNNRRHSALKYRSPNAFEAD